MKRTHSPHDCSALKGCVYTEVEKETYVCNGTGTVHLCGSACKERYVNRDSTISCKISGQCFDQMIQCHPFARVKKMVDVVDYTPKKKQKTTRKRDPFKSKQRDKYYSLASSIVRNLLFSENRRKILEEREKVIKKEVTKKCVKYKRECQKYGKEPQEKHLKQIYRAQLKNRRIVDILEEDPEMTTKYADQIVKLWYFMGKTPYAITNRSRLHFKEHVLGTLYLLQYGVRFETQEILKQDLFLYQQLPPIHDIKAYNLDKKEITMGKNTIMRCLRSQECPSFVSL